MAWIEWDAPSLPRSTAGACPPQAGEKRIRIAASLAADHPVSLRDAIQSPASTTVACTW